MTADPRDDAIAQFYESHPYPPPVDDLTPFTRGWVDGKRRRIEHHRFRPTVPYRDDHSILVAGCGTSQASKYAVRYPNARVVGIDVSATSITATQRLADRHGLTNLDLHELPIEQVGSLRQTFDHVVCTGVLHHLDDPAVGLSALRSVMAPLGAIHLMVYAPYGRTGVTMLQEYCRLLGVRPEPGEIDRLVASLRELPVGHPLAHLLRNTPDFSDDDALADALLNPRERAYTVPQLLDLLATAGLRFGRWFRQAPYRPQCGVLSELPHGHRIGSLPPVEQFAALELFRGTMVRHSVVAHRDDGPAMDIDFDTEDWEHFVPARTTTSIVVEDRLPAGSAAALLNRAHSYPDLVLFADAEQKRAFELVDGKRSCGEIGGDRRWFEQLWWHDLIVVDASGAT